MKTRTQKQSSADVVKLLRSLDRAELEERLEANAEERRALLFLVRAARRTEQQQQRDQERRK